MSDSCQTELQFSVLVIVIVIADTAAATVIKMIRSKVSILQSISSSTTLFCPLPSWSDNYDNALSLDCFCFCLKDVTCGTMPL
jgi:hypothetical protein